MRYDATMANAVEATGLVKRFGKTTALDGVDLVARQGRVLGVLGPNGAGKTTAVRILATLLKPDGGQASVCGYDVVRDAHTHRPHRAVRLEASGHLICGLLGCANDLSSAPRGGLRAPGWTWPPAWSAIPGCCTWTSRRPGLTRAAGPMCG